MNRQDQKAIDELFNRLDDVEAKSGPRDADAEAYIAERIAAQPSAPYYMAQTVIVQNQALEAAQKRIAELEGETNEEPGLFGGLFGASRPRGSVPRSGRRPVANEPAGGGFLAGAAQTAMGVAGGVVLGNLLAGAFFGGPAHAGEAGHHDGGNSDSDADAQDSDSADSADFDGGGDFGGDF